MKNGFQGLWEAIASQEKLKIKFSQQVQWINVGIPNNKKKGREQIYLQYKHKDHGHRKTYDFVIWSPPVKESLSFFYGDLFLEEKKLFSPMTNSYYCTTLVDAEGTKRSESPIDWFYGNIYSKNDNLIWATRDTYSAINGKFGKQYKTGKTKTGPDGNNKLRTSVVYQFSHPARKPSQNDVNQNLLNQFNQLGTTSLKVIKQYMWNYFPHFTRQQVEQGSHWRALELQGKHNIWYIGGALSFESIKSVVEYNQLLVNRMAPIGKKDDDDDDDDASDDESDDSDGGD